MSERVQAIVVEIWVDTNKGTYTRRLSCGDDSAERGSAETIAAFKERVIRAINNMTEVD